MNGQTNNNESEIRSGNGAMFFVALVAFVFIVLPIAISIAIRIF